MNRDKKEMFVIVAVTMNVGNSGRLCICVSVFVSVCEQVSVSLCNLYGMKSI